MNDTKSTINDLQRFFDAVKSNNTGLVVQYFRNEELNAWEFKEEDGYTGIYIS